MFVAVDTAGERRYQRWAAVASFAIAVVGAVFAAAAFPFSSRAEAVLFLLTNVAMLLALAYVPLYLQNSAAVLVRSIAWQAMARWMVLAVALVYWVIAIRPEGGWAFFGALAWEGIWNIVASAAGRRHWRAHDLAWTLYFAADLVLLAYVVRQLPATMTLAMMITTSAFLLIVTAGHGPRASVGFVAGIYIGLLYGGMGWLRPHAIAWFVMVELAAFGLSRVAARPFAVSLPVERESAG